MLSKPYDDDGDASDQLPLSTRGIALEHGGKKEKKSN
jgi:hypothetical protein